MQRMIWWRCDEEISLGKAWRIFISQDWAEPPGLINVWRTRWRTEGMDVHDCMYFTSLSRPPRSLQNTGRTHCNGSLSARHSSWTCSLAGWFQGKSEVDETVFAMGGEMCTLIGTHTCKVPRREHSGNNLKLCSCRNDTVYMPHGWSCSQTALMLQVWGCLNFSCILCALPHYSKALRNLYRAGTSSDELPFLQLVMDCPTDRHRTIRIVLS